MALKGGGLAARPCPAPPACSCLASSAPLRRPAVRNPTARLPACSAALAAIAQVAEGAAHVYPRLAPTCEWDTAAAQAVVEEAGGSVVQAGRCDNKGVPLEDWKVGGRGCCLPGWLAGWPW